MEDTDDYRFSNFFKTAVTGNSANDFLIQGIVKNVDISSKNYVLANNKTDIRGLPLNSAYKQDVYGLLSWLRSNTLNFPLSPDKNNITALKNEPLRSGYNVLLDIETLGKQYHTIEVYPYYYYYDLNTKTTKPLDVYMLTAEGYKAVNLFGNYDLSKVYPYKYYLDWENETDRRNVKSNEESLTAYLSSLYGTSKPNGKSYSLGNAQYLNFGEQARTYVGSSSTLGVNQNIGGVVSANDFNQSVKRWHFTLGLPSSAVVVDAGVNPTTENIAKYKNGKAEAAPGGVVLMTAIIRAWGDLYTLDYTQQSDSSFQLNGVTYPLPSNINNIIAVYNGGGKSSKDDLQINKTH